MSMGAMSEADARRKSVLVAGAGGALGLRIARRLAAENHRVIATYRTERPETVDALKAAGCETAPLDLADIDRAAAMIAEADAAVLTPILSVSGPAARAALARGARGWLVLFSSNNVAVDSASPVYAELRAEEAALAAAGGGWTLIRPTMIYGYAGDGTLSRLIATARKLPVLPLPGRGQALQQPIHVDDLAALAVRLLSGPSQSGVVAAAGPRAMSLRALYEAAAKAAGRGAVVSLPLAPLRTMAAIADQLGAPFPLDAKQLARIELDKTPVGAAPAGWGPEIHLEDGLARLARELGLPPSA